MTRVTLIVWSLVVLGGAASARAQDRVGGHFGVALPLVTHAQGETTTLADDFVVVFPTGITVRKSDVFAFDLEFAPTVQNDPRHIDLTLHPGVAGASATGTRSAVAWRSTSAKSRGASRRCSTRA